MFNKLKEKATKAKDILIVGGLSGLTGGLAGCYIAPLWGIIAGIGTGIIYIYKKT